MAYLALFPGEMPQSFPEATSSMHSLDRMYLPVRIDSSCLSAPGMASLAETVATSLRIEEFFALETHVGQRGKWSLGSMPYSQGIFSHIWKVLLCFYVTQLTWLITEPYCRRKPLWPCLGLTPFVLERRESWQSGIVITALSIYTFCLRPSSTFFD